MCGISAPKITTSLNQQTRCLVSPQKNTKKTSKRPPMHTPLGAVMQQIVIIVAVTQRVV